MSHIYCLVEIERRVLENLMLIGENTNIDVQNALLRLTQDCFYNPSNSQLYVLIRNCFNKQERFDFVDILNLVRGNDNLHYALEWIIKNRYSMKPMSSQQLEQDVDKLVKLSRLRKTTSILENTLQALEKTPDITEAQDLILEKINLISNVAYRESKDGVSFDELSDAYFSGDIEPDKKIPTTCKELNDVLRGGVVAKGLITIAGKPSHGKTGFAIWLMDAIARNQPDRQSLFFSLEMEAKHIFTRRVGIRAGKNFDDLDKEERLKAVASCMETELKIYDASTCRAANDIEYILTTARLKAMEKPLSVIVVDYLGLVQTNGRFERNDLKIADIVMKLANLALELDCIVIALTQVNRNSAGREDQCPIPSDAADGSQSERSSALWIGIDRPELYREDKHIYQNQFVVRGHKNRFGNPFELLFAFNDGTYKIMQNRPIYKRPFAANSPKNIEEKIFG